jgi:uncharacterized membrane protein
MQEAIALKQDYILAASKFGRKASSQSGLVNLPTWKFVRINLNRIWHFNPITLILRVIRKITYLLGREWNIDKISDFVNSIFVFLFGWFGRPLLFKILLPRYNDLFQKITIQRVERVREEESMIKESDQPIRFYRGPKVVNWMLSIPWVLPPGQSVTEGMEYYFADVRPGFEYLPYEVFMHGEYQGYLVLQFSDNGRERRLKVLDVDLLDSTWVLPIALNIGKEKRIDFLEMNYEYSSGLQGTVMEGLLFEEGTRVYQYHAASEDSPLLKYGEDIHFDLADGDFSFT